MLSPRGCGGSPSPSVSMHVMRICYWLYLCKFTNFEFLTITWTRSSVVDILEYSIMLVSTLHTHTHIYYTISTEEENNENANEHRGWSLVVKALLVRNGHMWKHHCIFSNVSSRFAKFRKLAWRGRDSWREHCPFCPPLATALGWSKSTCIYTIYLQNLIRSSYPMNTVC